MIKKIRTLFTLNKKQHQMEVRKAIITRDKVLLKPTGISKTVTINADEVDIVINGLNNIDEDRFRITDNISRQTYNKNGDEGDSKESKNHLEDNKNLVDSSEKDNELSNLNSIIKPLESSIPKKKIIRLSLYPDEYEMITEMISVNGFKRTEFLLASVSASKKQSFMSEYNKYTRDHKLRRLEEREAAQLIQEELRNNNVQ